LKAENIRDVILEILVRVEEKNSYLNILVQYYLNNYSFKKEDRAFLQETTYGVTRFRKKLDWIIFQFLKIQNKKLPFVIQNILRMSVYQIIFLDKVPDYAIVNEAVKLTKERKHFKYSNLVNGVLRNIIRKFGNFDWPDISKDPVEYISVVYSFPNWLIDRWIKRFGLELCEVICKTMNKKPNTSIRANSLKINMAELKKVLSEGDIIFKEGKYIPSEIIFLENLTDVASLKIFKDGLFSIQDESSALASRFLNPLPGQLIIDMCSGPGGKTTHMAQLMANKGRIIALEKNPKRLQMVREECKRLDIDIVETKKGNAADYKEDYFEKADKVLADVPCTGTGVIRKKPDIKWKNINSKQIRILNELQMNILNIASKYVKNGGELLYSTCSMEREENDLLIMDFLKHNKQYTVQDSSSFIKKYSVKKYSTEIKESIQLLPGFSGDDIDGFYMVKLVKDN